MSDDLQNTVRNLIAEITELDPAAIAPDAHLANDLGADSMSALELMASLERHFEIVIEPEHFPEMATLRQVTMLVARLVADK